MLSRTARGTASARRFLVDRTASTAIEYALIAALVSIAMLAGLTGTNDSIAAAFQNLLERVAEVVGRQPGA